MAPNDRIASLLDLPGGDAGVRALSLAHGCACTGRWQELRVLSEAALRRGRTPADLVEMGLQVVAYAGFPRAIETLGVVRAVLEASGDPPDGLPGAGGAPADEQALAGAGRVVFERIYADATGDVLESLDALCDGFSRWVLVDAYGRILGRPGLSLGDRELMAVSALALMALPAPLGSHIRGALRNGSTTDDVEDILRCSRALAEDLPEPSTRDSRPGGHTEDRARAPRDVIDQALVRLSRKVYQR